MIQNYKKYLEYPQELLEFRFLQLKLQFENKTPNISIIQG